MCQIKTIKLYSILIAAVLTLSVSSPVFAQNYEKPIEISTIQSSTNFGKLRGARYHAGVDIRTGGVEGKKIMSIDDGQIYRIGIKPWGYGKVLYVVHTDGRISVYGHLSKFSDEVEAYVESERYRLKKNDVDLFPAAGTFPVKRGEVIALSGNTGSSSGPHLHFEVREKSGDYYTNPIARKYLDIADDVAPQIFNVYYYTVDTLLGVPVHRLATKSAVTKGADGKYSMEGTMKLPGKGYFEVEVMDKKSNVNFNMGVYRISLYADQKPIIEYVMDGFGTNQNHWTRIVSDYKLNRRTKNDVFRLAVINDGAVGPFYRNVVNGGIIDPANTENIKIEVADDNGNISTMVFPVEYDAYAVQGVPTAPEGADVVYFRKNYSRTTDALTVTIPAGALYESMFYTQSKLDVVPQVVKSSDARVLSDYYSVHKDDTPIQSPVTLSFNVDVPVELRSKVVVAKVNGNGRLAPSAAEYTEGAITGKASTFGVWCAAADTTDPTIKPLFTSGEDMSGQNYLSFRISDDFSGVATFSAKVDGEWVILEHNAMKGTVSHYFDDARNGRDKNHTIEIELTDVVGNTAKYTGTYYR